MREVARLAIPVWVEGSHDLRDAIAELERSEAHVEGAVAVPDETVRHRQAGRQCRPSSRSRRAKASSAGRFRAIGSRLRIVGPGTGDDPPVATCFTISSSVRASSVRLAGSTSCWARSVSSSLASGSAPAARDSSSSAAFQRARRRTRSEAMAGSSAQTVAASMGLTPQFRVEPCRRRHSRQRRGMDIRTHGSTARSPGGCGYTPTTLSMEGP